MLVRAWDSIVAFVPGLLLIGLGLGGMLTPIGQRRSVELPRGAAGRDLRPLAQRLQPRLFLRHRDRRHNPRLGRRKRQPCLRDRDDHPRCDRPHWPTQRPTPSPTHRTRLTRSARRSCQRERATPSSSVCLVQRFESAPRLMFPLFAGFSRTHSLPRPVSLSAIARRRASWPRSARPATRACSARRWSRSRRGA